MALLLFILSLLTLFIFSKIIFFSLFLRLPHILFLNQIMFLSFHEYEKLKTETSLIERGAQTKIFPSRQFLRHTIQMVASRTHPPPLTYTLQSPYLPTPLTHPRNSTD